MKKLILLVMLLATSVFAAININTATVQELSALPGIGAKKAKAIVNYRKKHSFKSINDLKKVKGIGPKAFAKIKKEVSIKGKVTKLKNSMKAKKEASMNKAKKFKTSMKSRKAKAQSKVNSLKSKMKAKKESKLKKAKSFKNSLMSR